MKERKGRTEEQREPLYFDHSVVHLFIARNYLVTNGKVADVIATALSSSLCASTSSPSSCASHLAGGRELSPVQVEHAKGVSEDESVER